MYYLQFSEFLTLIRPFFYLSFCDFQTYVYQFYCDAGNLEASISFSLAVLIFVQQYKKKYNVRVNYEGVCNRNTQSYARDPQE